MVVNDILTHHEYSTNNVQETSRTTQFISNVLNIEILKKKIFNFDKMA